MAISEKKMKIVIANYFKAECNVNTSIREAFEKGFRIGVEKALSTRSEPQWIPCSERLPETSGTYLVSGMWESGRVAVGDCEYTSYDGYFNTAWNFDVLAWMLLPEPYQESEQDENR